MKVLLTSFFLLLLFSSHTLASCPTMQPGPVCLEYWHTDAVFVGVATQVIRTPNNTGLAIGPYQQTTVSFSVEEAFKGVNGAVVTVELDHCGHFFKEGERYLVFARRNPNNKTLDVRAGSTRTKPLAEAAEDLEYIRGLPTAEKGSKIFGDVRVFTFNVGENKLQRTSLPGINLSLVGNNQTYKTVADNEGKYEFARVPAGTYRLRAEIPSHLDYREVTLKVDGVACAQLDLPAWRSGQIAGRVLDLNGQPVRHIPISLVSVQGGGEAIPLGWKTDGNAGALGLTDTRGRFQFSYLPPGRYLLIVNRSENEAARGTASTKLLPTLYYPGVNNISGAVLIAVGNETKTQDYDFRLPIAIESN